MTQLLERAYAEVAQLPEPEQDIIATLILEELEDERKWQKSFAQFPDALAKLAEEAIADHHVGLTIPLYPETL